MKSKRIKVSKLDLVYSPTSQSCVDLQTLPTLGRSKASPLYPYLNSTYSSPILPHSQLTRIRDRKSKETEVTPALVSQIVKKYFIPIFDAQRQRQKNLNTAKTAEYSQSLSEVIENELKNSRLTLKNLKNELKQIERDKEKKMQEIFNLKQLILNHHTNFQCGQVLNQRQNRKNFQFSMNKVVKDFESAKKKNEKEMKKLYFEIIQNSTLDDKANTLDHFNSLFRMKSENMGEILKGLFLAHNHLSIENLKFRFNNEIKFLRTQCFKLDSSEYSDCINIQLIMHSIQTTAEQALDKFIERNSLQKDLKIRISKYTYERDAFSNEIKKNTEEKEMNLKKFIETEKKSNVLEEEYGKMNKRLRDINFRNKLADQEEKICKNCKKYFIDKDNYNWSCTTHPSEYGISKFYYCCGATDRESLGCRKSKHISEDLAEQEETRKSIYHSKLKCLTCGEFGHLSIECDKDPNPKVFFETGKIKSKLKKKGKVLQFKEEKLQNSSDSDFSDIEFSKKGAGIELAPLSARAGKILLFLAD